MKERIKLYSQAIQDLHQVSMEYIQNETRMRIVIETTLISVIAAAAVAMFIGFYGL